MKAYALLAGVWIGLCVAAIGWTAWGIVFTYTHLSSDPGWGACVTAAFGGAVLILALRFWKWVLTACLVAFGYHELHKLEKGVRAAAVVLTLWQLDKPENQERLGNYWKWLVAKLQDPGVFSGDARLLLRLGAVCGLLMYSSAAWAVFDSVRDNNVDQRRAIEAYQKSHPEEQAASYSTPTPSLPVPTPTPAAVSPIPPEPTPTPYPQRLKHRYVRNGKSPLQQFMALKDHGILVKVVKVKSTSGTTNLRYGRQWDSAMGRNHGTLKNDETIAIHEPGAVGFGSVP